MHSMHVATMKMVAQIMRGMKFECHHGLKLGISEMEFQLKVGFEKYLQKERQMGKNKKSRLSPANLLR